MQGVNFEWVIILKVQLFQIFHFQGEDYNIIYRSVKAIMSFRDNILPRRGTQ